MLHNVSLIIDDILDESHQRRGKPTMHFRFGLLPALMSAGFITAEAYQIVAKNAFNIRLFSELMKRLSIAECLQWRLRRQPLGVEDWLKIASEDTGSMFEVCACLATGSEHLRRFGHLLGVLYHGCDDVGDAKGLESLGGGGDEDLRDGILTLPAAFAIRDPRIRTLFCTPHPTEQQLVEVARAITASLREAEDYLDSVADEARKEARFTAANPVPLLGLVEHTRLLSQR
jgi:geranylgeranyl pyrophosphate synthase